MVKKSWVFTGIAWLLAALFFGSVLAVGSSTGWFGLKELMVGSPPPWNYQYERTWDPAAGNVEGLEITWGNGPITVRPGEGPLVTVTESAAAPLEEEQRLTLTLSGGVLRVEWDDSLLTLGALKGGEKQLVVEVPQAIAGQLEEFTCRNLAGDVTVFGLNAQEIDLFSAAGDLSLDSVSGGEARVAALSGDIQWEAGSLQGMEATSQGGGVRLGQVSAQTCRLETVTGPLLLREGQAGELSVETISGQVELYLEQRPQQAEVRSVSGDVVLGLRDNEGFLAEYSSVSGKFSSDFEGQQEKGSLLYRAGGPTLRFVTTGGDITLRRYDWQWAQAVAE